MEFLRFDSVGYLFLSISLICVIFVILGAFRCHFSELKKKSALHKYKVLVASHG